ncbi:MAG: hypothetical protein PVJ53_12545 [Desulfobacterales bacterium]
MAGHRNRRKTSSLVVIALAGLLLLAVLVTIKILMEPQIIDREDQATPSPSPPAGDAAPEAGERAVIDFGKLESDEDLQSLMTQRKKDYDVGEGIDIIARSDETLQIGDTIVSMQELQEQIRLKLGEITEETLGPDGQPLPRATENFGIYIVQPGDNIWNIHFRFLKDYFQRREVTLSPVADEPVQGGFSSGIGKLLKFSENIVFIYNIKDKQFSENLNLIEPQSKIVIYKMDRVFAFLEQVDYSKINRIQFDGDTLWVPAN